MFVCVCILLWVCCVCVCVNRREREREREREEREEKNCTTNKFYDFKIQSVKVWVKYDGCIFCPKFPTVTATTAFDIFETIFLWKLKIIFFKKLNFDFDFLELVNKDSERKHCWLWILFHIKKLQNTFLYDQPRFKVPFFQKNLVCPIWLPVFFLFSIMNQNLVQDLSWHGFETTSI